MDKLVIQGGAPLHGTVSIGGSKNAALPILFGTLLVPGQSRLTHIPELADISTTHKLLKLMGVQVNSHSNRVPGSFSYDASQISTTEAPYELVRTMRASVLCLGPLLARRGEAKVSLPGGCAIGARPVDLHWMALEKLGAKLSLDQGYIVATVPNRLRGAEISFPKISVGATENAIMAAVLAEGTTVLENAACEPEVIDLVRFLKSAGAKIQGEGTAHVVIEGVGSLHSLDFAVRSDRIQAGTLLGAVMMTGGKVTLTQVPLDDMKVTLDVLRSIGADLEVKEQAHEVTVSVDLKKPLRPVNIETEEYPGFPTDMQAQVMAISTIAEGVSIITENIFENRFMHVPELQRLGADITVKGSSAIVKGKGRHGLKGATVMATDLRASASLVMAGLVAEGETTVRRIYHLDRGYEKLEEKLRSLGAQIGRFKEDV